MVTATDEADVMVTRLGVSIVSFWGTGNRCLKQNGCAKAKTWTPSQAQDLSSSSRVAASAATASDNSPNRCEAHLRQLPCDLELMSGVPVPNNVVVQMRVQKAVGLPLIVVNPTFRMEGIPLANKLEEPIAVLRKVG